MERMLSRREDGIEELPLVVKYSMKGQCEKMLRAMEIFGESVNSTDSHFQSALFHAALKGHKKCLKELLKKGADPNQCNQDGLTPCHAAAMCGKVPKFPDRCKETCNPATRIALFFEGLWNYISHHLHDSRCQKRCLEYLVQYGGNLKMYTNQQETTEDIAKRRKKKSILGMIDEYYTLQASLTNPNSHTNHWLVSSSDQAISHYTDGQTKDVPETDIDEIESPVYCQTLSADGSLWINGIWRGGMVVTLRMLAGKGRQRDRNENGLPVMCVEHLLNEMDNLREMRHPHMVLLMGKCSGPLQKDMFMVLEPLQPLSLYNILHKEHGRFSLLEAVGILCDVTSAVIYLHNVQGVAHNIISSHAVYLSTVGGAKLCNVFCCQPPKTQIPGVCSAALKMYLPWMAPELMKTRTASFESDIFSLGVLLWEMWADHPPWPGLTASQLGRVLIQDGQRLPLTNNHIPMAPILKSCFGPPVARLPATQLLYQINYLKMTQFNKLNL